jgi:uncharacterized protein YodC (DUF2158 family)
MATINYVTLKFPEILLKHVEKLQDTKSFSVYRYTVTPGIIFRIPHGVMTDDVCHFFIEHEINLSNTIKTGTLTLKVQITVVPCHMGLFSGFSKLPGTYQTEWFDEDSREYDAWGDDRFVPDYERGTKRVVPLPVGGKTNLYEYLNEILFKPNEDLDIINQYAVNLGCQKDKLKDKVVFALAPEYTSATNPDSSKNAFHQTQLMFDFLSSQNLQLMP